MQVSGKEHSRLRERQAQWFCGRTPGGVRKCKETNVGEQEVQSEGEERSRSERHKRQLI